MSASLQKLKVIVISDGTGETATAIARAVLTQFPEHDVYFTRYKSVREKDQLDAIFIEAAINHDLIIYTLVSQDLRIHIAKMAREKHIRTLDLLGPALTSFSNFFEQEPSHSPGLLHAVNDEYFRRVEAMEFTLNHDDGRNKESLYLADVVLVGVSRTSKTPLSVYLSQLGIKVVIVPLIPGTPIPEELFKIDQRKIFALTIDPDVLIEIRKNRLGRLGADKHQGDYALSNKVTSEVEWANNIFSENKRWPVINVTGKAIEETAAEITKLLNMRKNNIFKQQQRRPKGEEE
jgi:regulator of PEP synthase PpsR (kinase-PPPase family)